MKFGQIAGNKRINDAIYYCFQLIGDNEARKFVQRFKEQPHDEIQVMHTFRELILGAFLSANRFCIQSDYRIESKTPDWCVLKEGSHPQCIIELVNFHPDAERSDDIKRQIHKKGIWCNFVGPNTKRLYHAIWDKASKYKPIASKYNVPYIVSVFSDAAAFVEQKELDECLFDRETGLFAMYPEVSGLLFFEESSGDYLFIYKPNPHANRTMSIPSGWLRRQT
ncbi:MAG: hypothetical protein ACYTEX_25065 [Planctomycetota bacterium]|jgi:hypothetical protein